MQGGSPHSGDMGQHWTICWVQIELLLPKWNQFYDNTVVMIWIAMEVQKLNKNLLAAS